MALALAVAADKNTTTNWKMSASRSIAYMAFIPCLAIYERVRVYVIGICHAEVFSGGDRRTGKEERKEKKCEACSSGSTGIQVHRAPQHPQTERTHAAFILAHETQ